VTAKRFPGFNPTLSAKAATLVNVKKRLAGQEDLRVDSNVYDPFAVKIEAGRDVIVADMFPSRVKKSLGF
jgi:hypothetical protein